MTIISTKRLLVQLAVLQAISSVAVLAFTAKSPTSSNLVGSSKSSHPTRRWNTNNNIPTSSSSSSTSLAVTSSPTDVDVDMPELGKEGVYHIMDERQYK